MEFVKWGVCAGQLSGMLVAPGVWTNRVGFPTIPFYPWIPELPTPICLGLSLALVIAILGVAFHPRPGRLALIPPLLILGLAIFDVSRIQPWAYQYGLLFGALSLMNWDEPLHARSRAAWASCCLVLVGVYFWSGLQKVNPIFATQVFPFLLHPLGPRISGAIKPLWPIAPLVETSLGLLLLWPKSRNWGLGLVLTMHLTIFAALGPFGQNYDSIVWPWSLWITVIAFSLFWNEPQQVFQTAWNRVGGRAIILLTTVLPLLNFVGLWDGFLSASFYSGKLRDGWIYLNARGQSHLPEAYRLGNKGLTQESRGRFRLDILLWSMSKMNAPPYGEPRFYPAIMNRLRKDGILPKDMRLVVQDPVSLSNPVRSASEMQWQ